MAKRTLTFGRHRGFKLPGPELDGMKINFPFTVTVPAPGALRDKVTKHSITVEISDGLLCDWDICPRKVAIEVIVKHLFEFARKEAIDHLMDDSLRRHHEIDIVGPEQNPFDLRKLMDPDGATYTVGIQEKGNGKIGF